MQHMVTLKNKVTLPALGIGTWYLGDSPAKSEEEQAAIRTGLSAGLTLIDTAEMYGDGRSERLVGKAIRDLDRSSLFLVSKVLPSNAGRRHMHQSLDATLQRLGTDYLDLYLCHWRGRIPLAETVGCLEDQVKAGKIRAWGVSNFDVDDMEELFSVPGGKNCLVNQVLYHAASRGIEYALLPWMRDHGVTLMAYCPLAQAGALRRGLMTNPVLTEIAAAHACTVSQVLLAWVIRDGATIAIPRTGNPGHAALNAEADRITLTPEDLAAIDRAFPAPTMKEYLDIV